MMMQYFSKLIKNYQFLVIIFLSLCIVLQIQITITTKKEIISIYTQREKILFSSRSNNNGIRSGGNVASNRVISIMNWNPKSRRIDPLFQHGDFNRCGHFPHHCSYTTNQQAYNTSDVIVIDPSSTPLDEFPAYRPKDQRWLFNGRHPPSSDFWPSGFGSHEGSFDIAMSFTPDADVFSPRGLCFDSEAKADGQNDHVIRVYGRTSDAQYTETVREALNYDPHSWSISMIAKKTQLAMWSVKDCRTQSLREKYVSRLSKLVNVDIYGKCKFPKSRRSLHDMKEWELMAAKYFFYLAFEDNLCDGFASDKIFKALITPIVPVVLGNVDYSNILPPKSFIDVRNYKSAAHLGRYLNYLSRNQSAYAEYFTWKKRYVCVEKMPTTSPACQLCKYLNDNYSKKSKIKSISNFWSPKKRCKDPKLFYKFIEPGFT